MVFYCCAYNCKNNTRDKSLAFHCFPLQNPELLKKWLRNMKWKDWYPEAHSRICSDHFEKKCYSLPTGPRRRLHTWAVPTIFSFPDHMQNKKRKIDPRSRRAQGTVDESVFELPTKRSSYSNTLVSTRPQPTQPLHRTPQPIVTVQLPHQSEESTVQDSSEPSVEEDTALTETSTQTTVAPEKKPSPSWTILGDESLERSMTIPSFFHNDYCLPRSIRWEGDDEINIMPHVNGNSGRTKPRIIEVKERWEWLGLDIRGPFSITTHKHTYIMTLTDYYSKWVEIFPLALNKIRDAAVCLSEVIQQMGYPLGVLTRLPKHLRLEMNRELKKHLNVNTSSLVLHHRQTGYLDLVTESLLSDMVCEVVKENPRTWHQDLPAVSLRFCCTPHPTTGKKPFTVMYGNGPPPYSSPRELPYSPTDIDLSSFIISYTEASIMSNKENIHNDPSSLPDQL